MPEPFLALSPEDQGEVLLQAANLSGRPPHLLEKDVWVVWLLNTLYTSNLGERLVFKGGTSLSKAYGVIRRFSEDVDLTYDVRALIPDLIGERDEALPRNPSEQRRWTDRVRERLPEWILREVCPLLQQALTSEALRATIRPEGEKVFVDYLTVAPAGSGYVAASVLLEFGARSTGEPATARDVTCDADGAVEDVTFPTARPRVMHAERTFWEKATAVHVFCLQERLRGERFARHWHDLSRLHRAGFSARAFADRNLANEVARHKAMFFSERAADRSVINYEAAVNGDLRLVPDGDAVDALADDYRRMVEDGLLLEDAENFATLMRECEAIQNLANTSAVR